jgi:hypothetical protein
MNRDVIMLIKFSKSCRHFRMTEIEGCPYALCFNDENHAAGPDAVACQLPISCPHYAPPEKADEGERSPGALDAKSFDLYDSVSC